MADAELQHFIFRGNAMPFGGRIAKKDNQPFFELIPCPPAAALPVVGGFSRATSGGAEHFNAFRWGATLAETKGEQLPDGAYQTTVTSSISDVWTRNDPHVFETDLLRVTLVSQHADLRPASIRVAEVMFGGDKGMFLDGDRIEVEYNNDLNEATTLEQFESRYGSDQAFFNRHQKSPDRMTGMFGQALPRTRSGYARTSIVDRVRWRGKVYEGHVLRFTGFGTIYFGEVLMNENNRRLTMVRMDLGSALEAKVAFAEADPNGNWGT